MPPAPGRRRRRKAACQRRTARGVSAETAPKGTLRRPSAAVVGFRCPMGGLLTCAHPFSRCLGVLCWLLR
jgi:hypothetical protein